jgi:ectoine hydroxylase-related dioxygenase (phytanoyl-CoA dioxygenase family)
VPSALCRDSARAYEYTADDDVRTGDCVFFNPAVFHAAGANLSTSAIHREANLLQVSSAMGRAMETVDRERVTLALYPVLQALSASNELTEAMVENVIAASAEGYPFPTNLDWDQPTGGLAPQSQADLVAHGLEQGWGVEKLAGELAQYARKRQTN